MQAFLVLSRSNHPAGSASVWNHSTQNMYIQAVQNGSVTLHVMMQCAMPPGMTSCTTCCCSSRPAATSPNPPCPAEPAPLSLLATHAQTVAQGRKGGRRFHTVRASRGLDDHPVSWVQPWQVTVCSESARLAGPVHALSGWQPLSMHSCPDPHPLSTTKHKGRLHDSAGLKGQETPPALPPFWQSQQRPQRSENHKGSSAHAASAIWPQQVAAVVHPELQDWPKRACHP